MISFNSCHHNLHKIVSGGAFSSAKSAVSGWFSSWRSTDKTSTDLPVDQSRSTEEEEKTQNMEDTPQEVQWLKWKFWKWFLANWYSPNPASLQTSWSVLPSFCNTAVNWNRAMNHKREDKGVRQFFATLLHYLPFDLDNTLLCSLLYAIISLALLF